MTDNAESIKQIERALRRAAEKFVSIHFPTGLTDAETGEELPHPATDLMIQAKQEGGELLIFDDEGHELTRCVVSAWLGNTQETFYQDIQPLLQAAIAAQRELIDSLPILRPWQITLTGEEGESMTELYLADDESMILSGELMAGLDDDLETFWQKLADSF